MINTREEGLLFITVFSNVFNPKELACHANYSIQDKRLEKKGRSDNNRLTITLRDPFYRSYTWPGATSKCL